MSKVDIKRLDSLSANDTAATASINDNFKAVQDAIENTLSRDGTTPNFMDTNLDMNSYKIINTGEATEDNDVVTLKYVREAIGNATADADRAEAAAARADSSAQSAEVAAANARVSAQASEDAAQSAVNTVNGFDAHAEEAKNNFDRNYNDKLVAFNINAVDKQNDFDTNAATLTARYDNNDLAKTKAFNENAQTMTDGYNQNAMLKIDDFDAHYTIKEMKFDDHAAIKQGEVDASASKAKQSELNAATSEANAKQSETNSKTNEDGSRLWAVGTIEEWPEGSAQYWAEQAASIIGQGVIQDDVISLSTTYSSTKLEGIFGINEDNASILKCLDVLNDRIDDQTTVPLASLQAIEVDGRPSHKAPGAKVYDERGSQGYISTVTASEATITTTGSRGSVKIVDTLDIQQSSLGQYYVALTADQIRNEIIKGKIVQLSFDDTIENTGEQIYDFETFSKDGYAVFRRNVITTDKAERINIKVDYQGIVTFEKAVLNALLKSGGSMSGALKFDDSGYIEANNSSATKGLALFGSKDGYGNGASLSLRDNTATGEQAGEFKLETGNNITGHTHTFRGHPDGKLYWDGKELVNKDVTDGKANINADNFTQTGVDNIIGFRQLDWTRAETLLDKQDFIPPCDGLIILNSFKQTWSDVQLWYKGEVYMASITGTSDVNSSACLNADVVKGETYRVAGKGNQNKFIPYKGAK